MVDRTCHFRQTIYKTFATVIIKLYDNMSINPHTKSLFFILPDGFKADNVSSFRD